MGSVELYVVNILNFCFPILSGTTPLSLTLLLLLLIDFDISISRLAIRIGKRCVLAGKSIQHKEYVNTVTAHLEYS